MLGPKHTPQVAEVPRMKAAGSPPIYNDKSAFVVRVEWMTPGTDDRRAAFVVCVCFVEGSPAGRPARHVFHGTTLTGRELSPLLEPTVSQVVLSVSIQLK